MIQSAFGLTIIYTQIVYTMRVTKTWEVAGKTLGSIRRKMTGKMYQSPKHGKRLEKLREVYDALQLHLCEDRGR